MRWLWWATTVLALLLLLLGGLWLAQGTGLLRIDPVVCMGSCEPVEAPSLAWSLAGGGMLAMGLTGLVVADRRLRRRGRRAQRTGT